MEQFDCNKNSEVNPNSSFRFVICDVFYISGRGTVVIGVVENETIHAGEEIRVMCRNGKTYDSTIKRIEHFRQVLDVARAQDAVGLVITGVSKSDIGKGDVIVKKEKGMS